MRDARAYGSPYPLRDSRKPQEGPIQILKGFGKLKRIKALYEILRTLSEMHRQKSYKKKCTFLTVPAFFLSYQFVPFLNLGRFLC